MNQEVIHVYFMPGMAAKPTIFEQIKLPEDNFTSHWLEWKLPYKNESLSEYAKRFCKEIKHENPVLVGVSFGGILVQEMSKHIQVQKIIIVSSVKSKHELPKRMTLSRRTKLYKFMPTSLMSNLDFVARFAFGKTASKRLELYRKYLAIQDKYYLDWAIDKVLNWDQEKPIENTIHIHGTNDHVFPSKYIKNFIAVKGGSHIMIINRFKWFNEHLPKLIME